MTMYHEGQRALQDRFDTRRLADRLEAVKVHAELTDSDRAFVAARDMFFLATVGPDGQPTCSFKAGAPGFVECTASGDLLFPWYDGNGMFLSAGNVLERSAVGMLFIDFEAQRRLRVEGDPTLVNDSAVVSAHPGAQFMVRVQLTRVYPNCPRYIPHMTLDERSVHIPAESYTPPVPAWKQSDWARDVLPVQERQG